MTALRSADLPETIIFPASLYSRLLGEACIRYPHKTFGYLLSDTTADRPTDFILFEDNIRNSDVWQPEFHSYGQYFIDHADAGFVATPEESWRVQKAIWARGVCEIGVVHSHQRHPANFSRIDWDMHRQRFSGLWHMIISLRNPAQPQVRVYAVDWGEVRELALHVVPEDGRPAERVSAHQDVARRDAVIARARALSEVDSGGRPDFAHAVEIIAAIDAMHRYAGPDVVSEVLADGLLRGSTQRYEDYVEAHMVPVAGAEFQMGTDERQAGHFCGETPRHRCRLSSFTVMRTPVTNELFSLIAPYDHSYRTIDSDKPAVNLSWAEAALFALWMGCRLPTEAEWEYCCGAGSATAWCCESERQLADYAWYSANSHDQIRPVATRKANALGLYDLHGNVWEWCLDDYDQDFYQRAPRTNPLNYRRDTPQTVKVADKVVRGGAMNALAEMCRTRYRIHEPAEFRAKDLGFRLTRDACLEH